jgi:peptidyl-prolyl cis-trans isomerase B (cyclophilin B)
MKVKHFYPFLMVGLILIFGLTGCDKGERKVVLETNYGEITLLLYDQTPKHRDNFVKLVKEGFYDSLLFHRVIPNFMIQGGDPNSRDAKTGQRLGGGGPGYTLEAEIGAPHFRGALAAARTGGASNPEKRSSGSQFYIVTGREVNDNLLDRVEQSKGIQYNETQREIYIEEGGYPMLDGDYTVFGEVIDGMDVVEEISQQTVDQSDRPIKNVWMVAKLK